MAKLEPQFDCDTNERSENINNVIYIGTKIVKAFPMTHHEFLTEKGSSIPHSENQEGYRVEYEDGYVSWSPKSVFERCYRPLSNAEIHIVNSFVL